MLNRLVLAELTVQGNDWRALSWLDAMITELLIALAIVSGCLIVHVVGIMLIGGLITATVLTLLIFPLIYYKAYKKKSAS